MPSPFEKRAGGDRCEPRYHQLEAGELFCSADPAQITLEVGPTVAVCLWDPAIHVGGVQHLQQPEGMPPERQQSQAFLTSVERLLVGLLDLGCRADNLQAGLFGGSVAGDSGTFQEGVDGAEQGNSIARAARTFLEAEGIPIVTSDVGGTAARRVAFRTDVGTAAVVQIEQIEPA